MKVYLLKNDCYGVFINPAGLVLCDVKVASSFVERLTGLIFRDKVLDSEGLLIEDCSSIHTCFMRFSLDVIFLDSCNRVLKIFRDLKPFRITPPVKNSRSVLEIKAGISSKLGIEEGFYLRFVD